MDFSIDTLSEKNLKQLHIRLCTLLLTEQFYEIGAYTIDVKNNLLIFEDEKISIFLKKSHLLVYFAVNINQILLREDIQSIVWNKIDSESERLMDAYIIELRELLSKDPNIWILNIRGKGYYMMVKKFSAVADL